MRGWRRGRQPPEDGTPRGSAGDADLVRAALCDRRAFAPLYTRYRDDVLRYCFYCLGDWEEAADAAQEVFLGALAGLSRLAERDDAFRGYLFRIAHNEVYDRQNRRRRRPTEPLDAAFDVEDTAPSPEHLAVVGDDQTRLLEILNHLSADRRRLCELRFAGLTDKEIALVLGKNEGAVRTAWSRAASQLRDLMGVGLARKGGGDA
jgi:RNA polymerase sigma-70 factor (ECF subfamily)